MIEQHPITPPPELVQQWHTEAGNQPFHVYIATRAARWGADQELEACCEWIADNSLHHAESDLLKDLRTARRPKPPSLKELALSELSSLEDMGTCNADTIRRALESLPD